MAGVEQARMKGMLESLQQTDPQVESIEAYSKFVVAYILQQDGWRKANIEGPVYVVRRRGPVKYQLIVKNQFSTNDLVDPLHPDWELDCQKNYVFYKCDDPQKKIRGLWFLEDTERLKLEGRLEACLENLRTGGGDSPRQPPADGFMDPNMTSQAPVAMMAKQPPSAPPMPPGPPAQAQGDHMIMPHHGQPQQQQQRGGDVLTLTTGAVRSAIHALAEDDTFIQMLMSKLEAQS
eukprot:TRINITY_DN63607_c0_g1_i1.p1 TRINITY_DN63607_c0_g1~~TRINITY_DN63607_c0_g1_i1.p1  ORF type:complete len:234 (+),score=58.92 TRINITY_DN63607_c0_g1_i1:83-784(+)